MKLQQLVGKIPTLTEIYDGRFTSLKWKLESGVIVGHAHLDEDEFRLRIEPMNFKHSKFETTWLNIAFTRLVDGVEDQTLTATNRNTSKVLGAVINALKDKIAELNSQYEIGALVFCVVELEKKRLSLYRKILGSKALVGLTDWNLLTSEFPITGGYALAAPNAQMPRDALSSLKAAIAARGKTLV
jgi:hypothetical protein